MAGHFEALSKFRVLMESKGPVLPADEPNRRQLAKLCLKAGDLGHAALPWEVHLQWSARMAREFYAQGDEEAQLGIPISALCNRIEVDGLAKSQQGFLKFVVAPLFEVISECQIAMVAGEEVKHSKPEDTSRYAEGRPLERKNERRMSRQGACPTTFQVESCSKLLQQNKCNWEEDAASVDMIITKIKSQLGPPVDA